MGQMTHAVMFAVDAGPAPKKLGEDGWHALLSRYRSEKHPAPSSPTGDTQNPDLIGFWVAVGASGKKDCPSLDKGFRLHGFCNVPAYRTAFRRAFRAWGHFAKWAATQGYTFDAPELWLVETEVA